MENITGEVLAKARAAQSVQELQALARENGEMLSDEEAKAYLEMLHQGSGSNELSDSELSDSELENVSGGGCYNGKYLVVTALNSCGKWTCPQCGLGKRTKNIHRCPDARYRPATSPNCKTCKYCIYKSALWLCTHPDKVKK